MCVQSKARFPSLRASRDGRDCDWRKGEENDSDSMWYLHPGHPSTDFFPKNVDFSKKADPNACLHTFLAQLFGECKSSSSHKRDSKVPSPSLSLPVYVQ